MKRAERDKKLNIQKSEKRKWEKDNEIIMHKEQE